MTKYHRTQEDARNAARSLFKHCSSDTNKQPVGARVRIKLDGGYEELENVSKQVFKAFKNSVRITQ